MSASTTPPKVENGRVGGSPPQTGGTSPPERDRVWHEWMMVGVAFGGLLALVAIVASVVALSSRTSTTTTIIRQASPAAGARGTSAGGTTGAGMVMNSASIGSGLGQSGAGAVVPVVLQLDATTGVAGTISGQDGWPRYAPSSITVPAGKKVTLVITNYDDASTPLAAGSPYNKVMGGTETVDGKAVSFVGNKTIAHTLTVQGLGVNVPVPMSPSGRPNTITFTFTAHKAGTYTWQCFTPCGTGKNGTMGPMMKPGFMQGTVHVVA